MNQSDTAINLEKSTIGFVGLGNMGFAMASNLADRGYKIIGYDIDEQVVQKIAAAHSVEPAKSPADLMAKSNIVILMLPNGKIVEEFLLAKETDGKPRVALLQHGSLVIDMSSSAPLGTRELGKIFAEFNANFLDAPVSGGVLRAQNGTLTIMIGGDKTIADRYNFVFEALGKAIIHVGPLGSGHAMKALNNYVSATGLVAACEALVVAQKFGIEGKRAIEVLNASTGANNSTENKLAQFVLSENFNSGFSLGLMRKDLATALDLAHDLDTQVELVDQVVALWERAETDLGGQSDHTEIARMFKKTR